MTLIVDLLVIFTVEVTTDLSLRGESNKYSSSNNFPSVYTSKQLITKQSQKNTSEVNYLFINDCHLLISFDQHVWYHFFYTTGFAVGYCHSCKKNC